MALSMFRNPFDLHHVEDYPFGHRTSMFDIDDAFMRYSPMRTAPSRSYFRSSPYHNPHRSMHYVQPPLLGWDHPRGMYGMRGSPWDALEEYLEDQQRSAYLIEALRLEQLRQEQLRRLTNRDQDRDGRSSKKPATIKIDHKTDASKTKTLINSPPTQVLTNSASPQQGVVSTSTAQAASSLPPWSHGLTLSADGSTYEYRSAVSPHATVKNVSAQLIPTSNASQRALRLSVEVEEKRQTDTMVSFSHRSFSKVLGLPADASIDGVTVTLEESKEGDSEKKRELVVRFPRVTMTEGAVDAPATATAEVGTKSSDIDIDEPRIDTKDDASEASSEVTVEDVEEEEEVA